MTAKLKLTKPKKARRRNRQRQRTNVLSLPTIRPDAAGVDIGARAISVCVPPDRAQDNVRTFETFTDSLEAIADWLEQCGIKTVAMESTGNYWIALHQLLSSRGFEVVLVNAYHVRSVPGRKSDVIDCQWLQHLHSVGLLRASFRPAQEICALRSLVRFRDVLVAQSSQQVLLMHNACDQMNLQIQHVLSDLTGVTGVAIVTAIVAGQRDPKKLAAYRQKNVKASRLTIERSLRGQWREEHLLVLRLAFESWQHVRAQIEQLDVVIASQLRGLEGKVELPDLAPPRQRKQSGAPTLALDLRTEFYRVLGTDLTAIPGLSVLTVQSFISEVGPDLSRFKSSKSFCAWLRLCPGTRISGGKVLSARTPKGKPALAYKLRQAALTIERSAGALGVRYRRLRARLGPPQALTAIAHLYARLIYHLVTTGQAYDESAFARLEAEHEAHRLKRMRAHAKKLGYDLVPLPT